MPSGGHLSGGASNCLFVPTFRGSNEGTDRELRELTPDVVRILEGMTARVATQRAASARAGRPRRANTLRHPKMAVLWPRARQVQGSETVAPTEPPPP